MCETFQPVLNVPVIISTLRNVSSFRNEEKRACVNKHSSVFMSAVRLVGVGILRAVKCICDHAKPKSASHSSVSHSLVTNGQNNSVNKQAAIKNKEFEKTSFIEGLNTSWLLSWQSFSWKWPPQACPVRCVHSQSYVWSMTHLLPHKLYLLFVILTRLQSFLCEKR